jgi:hypothetical protein
MSGHSIYDPESRSLAYLDLLPPVARKKYRRLEQQIRDAAALQESILAQERNLEDRYHSLMRRLKIADPKHEPDRVALIEAELSEVSDELERLRGERSKRNAVRASAEQILTRLRGFLAGDNIFRDAPYGVRPYSGAPARLNNGESLEAALDRVRSAISRTQGEQAVVRAAPPSRDEVAAQLTAQINKMAAEGAPKISLDGGKVSIAWPDVQLYAVPGSGLSAPSGSASKLICFLFNEMMIKQVTASVANIEGGLSAAERAQRIAELDARVSRLEHEDEQLVEQALARGLEIHRRVDAHPFALLSIEAITEADAAVAQARAKTLQAMAAE